MTTYTVGSQSNGAGTAYVALCPPVVGKVPVLKSFSYTTGIAEHQMYVMPCVGLTTNRKHYASPAGQLTVARLDPGTTSAGVHEDLALNDYLAFSGSLGQMHVRRCGTVSGVEFSLESTISDSILHGSTVFAFYEPGRYSNVQIRLPASTTTTILNADVEAGVPLQRGVQVRNIGAGLPLLVVVDNVSTAGKLDFVAFEYIDAADAFVR